MDVRQLEFAVRLAETLHFGQAAASVFISQPAFSAQIARLEREIGCQLFNRSSHRVTLTEGGQHFIERTQLILTQIYSASYEAQTIQRGTSILRVGYFGEGAAELSHPIYSAARRTFPQTEIHVVELLMTNLVSALVNQEVDVAFLRTPIVDSRLTIVPLFLEPRVAVVPSDSELATAESLSMVDLVDHPFAVAATGAPLEWSSFWSLDESRGSSSRVGGAVKTIAESLATVAYCNAVDTFPASATRMFSHPGVAYVPLVDAPFSELSIVRLASNQTHSVTDFITCAVDTVSKNIASMPAARLPEPPATD